jgi:hypothetical protein
MEGWKDGRMEGWKDGRMEGWKDGRMEGWKAGRQAGRVEGRQESRYNEMDTNNDVMLCVYYSDFHITIEYIISILPFKLMRWAQIIKFSSMFIIVI